MAGLLLLWLAAASAAPVLEAASGPAPVDRAGFGAAPAASEFVTLGRNEAVQASTTVRVVQQGARLHVLFECLEPRMGELKAAVTHRDGPVWEDDCVELFLAPVADRPEHYYHFLVNAAGIGRDEWRRDEAWDCSAEFDAERAADRWWARIVVPLDELDYPDAPTGACAVNFCRERRPVAELSSWAPMADSFHDPARFGRLVGITGLEPFAASSLGRQVAIEAPRVDVLAEAVEQAEGPLGRELRARLVAAREDLDAARAGSGSADRTALAAGFARLQALRRGLGVAEALAGRAKLAAGDAPFALASVSTMHKVRRDDPLRDARPGPIRLSAARGEGESAQVVIVPLLRPLREVTAEVTPVQRGDVSIPVELRRVDGVTVTQPSGGAQWGAGWWPDPLVEPVAFDIDAEEVRSLWLTVDVPRDAAAGEYLGRLTVRAAEVEPVSTEVRLRVYDFSLPRATRLRNDFQIGSGHVAQRHRVSLHPAVPPGWHYGTWVGADVQGIPDYFGAADFSAERVALDGGHALRLRCENWRRGSHEGPRLALFTEPIELEVGAEYVVTLRYRQTEGDQIAVGGWMPGYGSLPLARSGEWTVAEKRLVATADQPTTRLYFGIYQAGEVWYDDVRMTKVGSDENLLPPADFEAEQTTAAELMSRYRELLLRYRCSDQNVARPVITYDEEDRARIDWTEFDREIEHYLALGLNAFNVSWVPLPGGWGKVAEFADESQVRRCRDVLAQTQAHLEEKGWLDLAYLYVIDEPGADYFPQVRAAFELVGEAAPKLKRLLTFGYGATRPWRPGAEGQPAYAQLADVVDIFVPHSDCFDARFLDTVRGKDNNEIWCYVCISAQMPYANIWAIDYPGVVHRALFWQMLRERIEGFLYWNVTYWQVDPWEDPLTYPGGNGDGSLLYPGESGPVPSQRLAIVRDGLDDYDYVTLLREALARGRGSLEQRAAAERLLDLSELTPSWTEFALDPAAWEARRAAIGELLETLLRP